MFDTVPAAWLAEHADVLPPHVWEDVFTRCGVAAHCHYVTATEADDVVLLVGPFASHDEALHWIGPARDALSLAGAPDVADSVATTRLLFRSAGEARPGHLNATFGITHDARVNG